MSDRSFGFTLIGGGFISGQVVNTDSLAHLEHEYVGALSEARGVDNQARGLRDFHEKACRLAVCNGHRPAARGLLDEPERVPMRQHGGGRPRVQKAPVGAI